MVKAAPAAARKAAMLGVGGGGSRTRTAMAMFDVKGGDWKAGSWSSLAEVVIVVVGGGGGGDGYRRRWRQ